MSYADANKTKFKRTVVDNANAPEYIRVIHREDFEEALNALYERSGGFEDEETIDGYCALMDLVDEHTVRIPLSATFSDPVKVEGSEPDPEEDVEETEPDEDEDEDLSSHESDDISDDESDGRHPAPTVWHEDIKDGHVEDVPFSCLSDIQFGKEYQLWIDGKGWIDSPVRLIEVSLAAKQSNPILVLWFEDADHISYQLSADGYDCGWKIFQTDKRQDNRFDYLTVHLKWICDCGDCKMCNDGDKDSEK